MATKRSAADSTSAANSITTPRKGDKSKRGKDTEGTKTNRRRSSNKQAQQIVTTESSANDAGTQPTLGRTRSKTNANRVTPGGNEGPAPPDKPSTRPQRSPNSKKKKKRMSKKEKEREKIRQRLEAVVNATSEEEEDQHTKPPPQDPAEKEEVISINSDADQDAKNDDDEIRKAEEAIQKLEKQLQERKQIQLLEEQLRRAKEKAENDSLDSSDDMVPAHIYKDRAVAYWFKKLGTVPDHAPIDWESSQRAMKRCPTYRRLWQPKWLSGFVPTGKNLKRWKIQLSDACPRCGNAELSTNHTLRCPDDSAKTKWAALLTNLDEWLATSFTHPDLRQGIIKTLTAWHDHLPPPCIDSDYTGISELFELQQSLGPDAFIKGILCSQWAETQQRYYEWIESKKTGLRWVSSLIKKFWDIAWDMWQHRMKIADDPDSAATAAEHLLLDNDITMEYQEFATILNNPPRHRSRWFARPIEVVQTEDIDFKRQWLDAVRISKKATAEQQASGWHLSLVNQLYRIVAGGVADLPMECGGI